MLFDAEMTTGHEVALIVVAAVFIAFALVSSFVIPRWKPDFPGPNGLSVFVIVSLLMFSADGLGHQFLRLVGPRNLSLAVRRSGRVAEGGALLRRYGAEWLHRGFESLLLR